MKNMKKLKCKHCGCSDEWMADAIVCANLDGVKEDLDFDYADCGGETNIILETLCCGKCGEYYDKEKAANYYIELGQEIKKQQ